MMDEAEIKRLLLNCWSGRTSSLWTPENPARGQCGVTALVIQNYFRGEIMKTRLPDGRWHFYNRIGGRRYDFTASQFDFSIDYSDEISSLDEALADTNDEQFSHLSSAFRRLIENQP